MKPTLSQSSGSPVEGAAFDMGVIVHRIQPTFFWRPMDDEFMIERVRTGWRVHRSDAELIHGIVLVKITRHNRDERWVGVAVLGET